MKNTNTATKTTALSANAKAKKEGRKGTTMTSKTKKALESALQKVVKEANADAEARKKEAEAEAMKARAKADKLYNEAEEKQTRAQKLVEEAEALAKADKAEEAEEKTTRYLEAIEVYEEASAKADKAEAEAMKAEEALAFYASLEGLKEGGNDIFITVRTLTEAEKEARAKGAIVAMLEAEESELSDLLEEAQKARAKKKEIAMLHTKIEANAKALEEARKAYKEAKKEAKKEAEALEAQAKAFVISFGLEGVNEARKPSEALKACYSVSEKAICKAFKLERSAEVFEISGSFNASHSTAIARTVAKTTARNMVSKQPTATMIEIDRSARASLWYQSDLYDMLGSVEEVLALVNCHSAEAIAEARANAYKLFITSAKLSLLHPSDTMARIMLMNEATKEAKEESEAKAFEYLKEASAKAEEARKVYEEAKKAEAEAKAEAIRKEIAKAYNKAQKAEAKEAEAKAKEKRTVSEARKKALEAVASVADAIAKAEAIKAEAEAKRKEYAKAHKRRESNALKKAQKEAEAMKAEAFEAVCEVWKKVKSLKAKAEALEALAFKAVARAEESGSYQQKVYARKAIAEAREARKVYEEARKKAKAFTEKEKSRKIEAPSFVYVPKSEEYKEFEAEAEAKEAEALEAVALAKANKEARKKANRSASRYEEVKEARKAKAEAQKASGKAFEALAKAREKALKAVEAFEEVKEARAKAEEARKVYKEAQAEADKAEKAYKEARKEGESFIAYTDSPKAMERRAELLTIASAIASANCEEAKTIEGKARIAEASKALAYKAVNLYLTEARAIRDEGAKEASRLSINDIAESVADTRQIIEGSCSEYEARHRTIIRNASALMEEALTPSQKKAYNALYRTNGSVSYSATICKKQKSTIAEHALVISRLFADCCEVVAPSSYEAVIARFYLKKAEAEAKAEKEAKKAEAEARKTEKAKDRLKSAKARAKKAEEAEAKKAEAEAKAEALEGAKASADIVKAVTIALEAMPPKMKETVIQVGICGMSKNAFAKEYGKDRKTVIESVKSACRRIAKAIEEAEADREIITAVKALADIGDIKKMLEIIA